MSREISWHDLSEEEQRDATERFTGLSLSDQLYHRITAEDRTRSYGFGDLIQYVQQPDYRMSDEMHQRIETDANLKQALEDMLMPRVVYQFPRAAAASTGDLDQRDGDGFSITIRASRAQESQVYIILRIDDIMKEEPRALWVKSASGAFHKKGLPLAVDGVFQILAESSEDFVLALRDVASEVYLN